MQMGPRSASRGPDRGQFLAPFDSLAGFDKNFRYMPVPCNNTITVIDHYHTAIPGVSVRGQHNAVGRGNNRAAPAGSDVQTSVELYFYGQGMKLVPKPGSNVAIDRSEGGAADQNRSGVFEMFIQFMLILFKKTSPGQ